MNVKNQDRILWALCVVAVAGLCWWSFAGCVATSGDVHDIGQAQIDSGLAVRGIAAQAASGALDMPAALDQIGVAMVNAGQGTQDVADGIERRVANVTSGASGGLGLGSVAGIAGLVTAFGTALGGAALNQHRNRTRKTDPLVANALKT